ncbi:MAG: spore coat protein CotJB [Bacilli bacterium]|nr:spore coat protein CotJB [Bacilli bacterium]
MNNYNIANDYYNYANNNYNIPHYDPEPNEKMKLYDPYNGFIRGNMFPALYNSYKTSKPFEIEPINEQAELLTYIDAYGFAAHDIHLYLDVNPTDREMINFFNQFKDERNKVVNQYEQKFGPLNLNSDALNRTPWAWINDPWPWDNR